jgi:hypothetical protein
MVEGQTPVLMPAELFSEGLVEDPSSTGRMEFPIFDPFENLAKINPTLDWTWQ